MVAAWQNEAVLPREHANMRDGRYRGKPSRCNHPGKRAPNQQMTARERDWRGPWCLGKKSNFSPTTRAAGVAHCAPPPSEDTRREKDGSTMGPQGLSRGRYVTHLPLEWESDSNGPVDGLWFQGCGGLEWHSIKCTSEQKASPTPAHTSLLRPPPPGRGSFTTGQPDNDHSTLRGVMSEDSVNSQKPPKARAIKKKAPPPSVPGVQFALWPAPAPHSASSSAITPWDVGQRLKSGVPGTRRKMELARASRALGEAGDQDPCTQGQAASPEHCGGRPVSPQTTAESDPPKVTGSGGTDHQIATR